MTEPLASPTLAQLYLAQGHVRRARATLEEVLDDDPYNGHALALLERMVDRPRPELHAGFVIDAGELELRWSVPSSLWPDPGLEARLTIVLAITTRRADPSLRFTSLSCQGPRGSQRMPAPPGPASAALALVAREHGHRFGALRFLAVADPLSW
jgi:hypothetical protein